MFKIGCHLSSSNGYKAMGETAVKIGANTFQFFTRNPRGGAAKPINEKDMEAFNLYAKEQKIEKILAHAPYVLNPAAAKEDLREFAFETMKDDLYRLSFIPGTMYNFHPGSHVKQGVDVGMQLISDHLNRVMEYNVNSIVLLETMAGKGSEMGRNFEELQTIIEKTERKDMLGVCMDTCHVYDGEYDIVGDLDGVLKEFEAVIGMDRLKAIHLNDSKNPFGSHKDRHEKIGEGSIGISAIERIINHPLLRELPFYLETPNELEGYEREILLLKGLYRG